jgi:hypothetical protein
LPETSAECKLRARELRSQPDAVEKGIIVENTKYSWNEMWTGAIAR